MDSINGTKACYKGKRFEIDGGGGRANGLLIDCSWLLYRFASIYITRHVLSCKTTEIKIQLSMKHKRRTRERGGEEERESMCLCSCVCTCALDLYSILATYSYNAHCVKMTFIWTRICWMHHIKQLALFYAITTLTHTLRAILHTSL